MVQRQLMTVEDVASTLQIEPAVVLAWIEEDQLDAVELSPGVLRIDPGALKKFILVRRRQFQPGGWRRRLEVAGRP